MSPKPPKSSKIPWNTDTSIIKHVANTVESERFKLQNVAKTVLLNWQLPACFCSVDAMVLQVSFSLFWVQWVAFCEITSQGTALVRNREPFTFAFAGRTANKAGRVLMGFLLQRQAD